MSVGETIWLLSPLAALQDSQNGPGFFDQHCASKDYDGCYDADGFERMRVTLLDKPLRPFDCAKKKKNESDGR